MTQTLVAALLVLLAASGAALYEFVRGALTRQFDEGLLAKGRALGALLRPAENGKVEFDFTDNTMPEFARPASGEYFELWRPDGTIVDRSESLQHANLPLTPQAAENPRFLDVRLPLNRDGRAVMLEVSPTVELDEIHTATAPLPPQTHDTYILTLARDREGLNHTLTIIEVAGVGGIGLLALAFAILVPWVIRRNLRPLETIASQAGRIDAGALAARFPVDAMPAELRPICARLNDSLERLQTAFARERRFSADVAHELRTPIAELRLLSELALKFPAEPREAARSFRDALEIARQMESIVETLLEMIRADDPLPAEALVAVNVGQALRHAWRAEETEASKRNITLSILGHDAPTVAADPAILQQVLANLLANAVEYSPQGSLIEASLEASSDRTVLTLRNPTAGLGESDMPHLAEPFWRKDTSRTGTRHAGLGLALVACYGKRLRGRVQWRLPQVGVFEVSLELPRPAGAPRT
jgi:signal transduction histidine kinase